MIKLFDENMNEVVMDQNEYQERLFPLENFSAFSFIMDKKTFNTSEHAFQYLKFASSSILTAEAINATRSPYEAREEARKYREFRTTNYFNI